MGEPAKYILLVDRALSLLSTYTNWYWSGLRGKREALRGDIFEALPEAEQPSDGDSIALKVVGSRRLRCSKADVIRLSDEEANLLLPISCLGERYATFVDTKRLDFGRRLSPGEAVFVSEKGHTKDLPGVVRYKGELPTCPGTMFGVELTENPGQGNSDGKFRDKRYFTCPPSSAVFVGLDKLRPREVSDSKSSERDENAQANFKSRLEKKGKSEQSPQERIKQNFKSRLEKKGKSEQSPQERIKQVLEIEQRVVTFIEDRPARGTVRYIDQDEYGSGNMRTIVGLEMDEKCGSGTGERNGRQFFVCRNDFAAFVDIRNLVREEDFDGKHEETTCTGKKTQDKQEAVHKEIRKDGINLSENDQQEENSRRHLREMKQLREKDEQEENLQRQLREMEQQLREKDEQEENSQRQLREMEQQLREKDEQEENLQRQLRALEKQLREKDEQEENLQRQQREMEQQLREKDEKEENLQRQLRALEQRLREKDEQEETSQRQQREMERQLREKDEQEENLQRQLRALEQQLREKDEQEETSQRQQREMERQLRGKDEQEENLQRQLRALEQRLREKDEQEESLQRQLRALEQRLREKDEQEENSQRQQREMERQLREKDEQEENSQRHQREMEQQLTNLQDRYREKEDETANLHEQVNELEVTLSTAQQVLSEHQRRQVTPDWVISRDQIQLTDQLLGRGGWGSVVEGKYCGCYVAVKQIHELILSPHSRSLFEREMAIASRCRHPCLLQFIGATNDEGSPLFVTELMESSLRALLEQRPLAATEVSTISLDVAQALNYLHQKKPSPIIHRDISSANVLLWRQGDQWRGKVSDYGTANFMQHTMTVGPGATIYMAPEALTSNQTVKVDVYSFAVLLCEMCVRELPDPERRDQQIAMVTNRLLRALIRRCLQSDPEARPNMEEIIEELEEPV